MTTPTDARGIADSRSVLRVGSRSFFMASRLLPPEVAERAAQLYALCRRWDDLADLGGAAGAARLAEIGDRLAARDRHDPDVGAFLDLADEAGLPVPAGAALLAALTADAAGRPIATDADLLRYAYGVAGTVGLLMTPILGCRDPAAAAFAVDLGVAMQLTNICRDVLEDARRGRLYLPTSRLAGAPATALVLGELAARIAAEAAVVGLLARAERHYASAEIGIALLPRPVRPAIGAALMLYRAIGRRIARRPGRIWRGRTRLPRPMQAGLVVIAWARFRAEARDRARHDATLHRDLRDLPFCHAAD